MAPLPARRRTRTLRRPPEPQTTNSKVWILGGTKADLFTRRAVAHHVQADLQHAAHGPGTFT